MKLDVQIIVSTVIYLMYSLSRQIYNWTTAKWLRRINVDNIANIQADNLQHSNSPEVLYKKHEEAKKTARGFGLRDQ